MSPWGSDCLFTAEIDGLGVQSLRIPFGFLLIVRTGWIVTALAGEYHRILGVSSIQPSLKTAS